MCEHANAILPVIELLGQCVSEDTCCEFRFLAAIWGAETTKGANVQRLRVVFITVAQLVCRLHRNRRSVGWLLWVMRGAMQKSREAPVRAG